MKEIKNNKNILGEIPGNLTTIGVIICIIAVISLIYASTILFSF